MAQTNRERLKRFALLGFIALSVGFIALIWVDGLTGDEPATPSYYRDSFQMDPSVYLTVTAEAIEFQQNLADGTPPPTTDPEVHNGPGNGQGQGHGQNDEHDEPTATETPQSGG